MLEPEKENEGKYRQIVSNGGKLQIGDHIMLEPEKENEGKQRQIVSNREKVDTGERSYNIIKAKE